MQVIARGPLRKVKLPLTCLIDVSEVEIRILMGLVARFVF